MRLDVKTAPTSEPVTLSEAKAILRVTHNRDDSRISSLIELATDRVELETGRQLMPATYLGYMDSFPLENYIEIPISPVSSVTSVTYADPEGSAVIFPSAGYTLIDVYDPPRIVLDYGSEWPSTRGYDNDVLIEFVAGYATAAAIPAGLKHLVHYFVQEAYDSESGFGSLAPPPDSIKALIWQYKLAQV